MQPILELSEPAKLQHSYGIRAIAASARVTKPLVHYHFGSKQHLFSTLLGECIDSCRSAAHEISVRHE